jgi:hypothetical protein
MAIANSLGENKNADAITRRHRTFNQTLTLSLNRYPISSSIPGAVKPAALCAPSQNGLFAECPQRHRLTRGFSISSSRPSAWRIVYEPLVSMRIEPFSLMVIFTSSVYQPSSPRSQARVEHKKVEGICLPLLLPSFKVLTWCSRGFRRLRHRTRFSNLFQLCPQTRTCVDG